MNNEMKFDPITGQPINNPEPSEAKNIQMQPEGIKTNSAENTQVQPEIATAPIAENAQTQTAETKISTTENTQQNNNLQSVATIDQSNEQFLNNEQNNANVKSEKMNEKSSYVFIFVLFAIILLAIIFLFPLLDKFF